MRMLVLGGTRFLSARVCALAVAAGYEVTVAARGVHGTPPEGAIFVRWDRTDPVPPALRDLTPDVVVDVTTTPAFARAAVAAWGSAHWIYVSTVSVYADQAAPGGTPDTTPVLPAGEDPADEEWYGKAKVACEEAVRAGAASYLIVRPGLIVGPGDGSGRFTYWPVHAAAAARDGGGLLVPGTPDDPVQYIDVADLAAWIVRSAATRLTGTYDAVGPSLTWAQFVAGLAAGIGADVHPTYVPGEDLVRRGITEWMGPGSLPLWIADPAAAGLMMRDVRATLAAGLTVRPPADTVRDTLAWYEATPDAAVTGLTRVEERAVLRSVSAGDGVSREDVFGD